MIAVTGATGALGKRVVERLAASDAGPFRVVVRTLPVPPTCPERRSSPTPAATRDRDGPAALTGADTLYLVSAAEAEDRLDQHVAAVDAAAAAGVQRIVYTSFLNASPDAVFTLVRQHAATEDRIRQTGVRHTFLRHSMYADFVPFFASVEDGEAVIAAPAGNGRTSFVSRDDLADVATAVLLP